MFEFQIFSFRGTPVFLRPLFFLLLFMVTPSILLGLFISVLIHEIAHTWVAQNLGYPVKSIYIDLMNGAAMIDIDKSTPVDSIKIVCAGPPLKSHISIIWWSINISWCRLTFFG